MALTHGLAWLVSLSSTATVYALHEGLLNEPEGVVLVQLRAQRWQKGLSSTPLEDLTGAAELEDLTGAAEQSWGYATPQDWGLESPDCWGQEQSPVDIETDSVEPCSNCSVLRDFASYGAVGPFADLKVVNTGHAIQVNGAFGEMRLPDGVYFAKQLQFHVPSEHTLDGERLAGELHIVHQRADANGTEGLAILSVLLREGVSEESWAFYNSLGFAKQLPIKGAKIELSNATVLNLGSTIHKQLSDGFWHYSGSLTTPPCSETVRWYISKQPLEVSKRMAAAFRSASADGANSRPVSPLNGRMVVDSQVGILTEFTDLQRKEALQAELGMLKERKEAERPHVKDMAGDKWTYDSPEAWMEQYSECGGASQSPVDIDFTQEAPDAAPFMPAVMYGPVGPYAGLGLANDGHSMQLEGRFGQLILPDGIYNAKKLQFHFPSEHRVNGVSAAGEVHIVHQRQGATGMRHIAVVAILLQVEAMTDEASQFFGKLDFQQMPPVHESLPLPDEATQIDLGDTFRKQFAGDYYHYKGSLTVPPCSETVHWYVMKESFPVSIQIVGRFRDGFPNPGNSRPVQPLNNRSVVTSSLAVDDKEYAITEDEADATVEVSSAPETPKEWAQFPNCGGTKQSPIELQSAQQLEPGADATALSKLFSPASGDDTSPARVRNAGGALEVVGDFGTLQLPDGDYKVSRLILHFPSEHIVDGRHMDGEIQIMMKSASGSRAAIGVLLTLSEKPSGSSPMHSFLGHIGMETDKLPEEDAEVSLPSTPRIDLAKVFAESLGGDYWHYSGSLTAPPCDEQVHWYVLQTPAVVTKRSVKNFKMRVGNKHGGREAQNLNGRRVVKSLLETDSEEFLARGNDELMKDFWLLLRQKQ